MTDILGKPYYFVCVCMCQVTKALLEGDRLLLNRQSRWHAVLDVTVPRNVMPTSKQRHRQTQAALCFIICILLLSMTFMLFSISLLTLLRAKSVFVIMMTTGHELDIIMVQLQHVFTVCGLKLGSAFTGVHILCLKHIKEKKLSQEIHFPKQGHTW